MSNEVICRYFVRGICRFGENCRFAHTLPLNNNNNNNDLENNNQDNNINNIDNNNTSSSNTNHNTYVRGDNLIELITQKYITTVISSPTTSTSTLNNSNSSVDNSDSNTNLNKNNSDTITSSKALSTATVPIKIQTNDPNSWVMAPVFVPRQQNQNRIQQKPTSTQQMDGIEIINLVDDDDDDIEGAVAVAPSNNNDPQYHDESSMDDVQFVREYNLDSESNSGGIDEDEVFNDLNGFTGLRRFDDSDEFVEVRNNTLPTSASASTSTTAGVSDFNLLERSYADVLSDRPSGSRGAIVLGHKSSEFCPYEGYCTYGEYCVYQHGDLCDLCDRFCLHPTDQEQRRKHINECIQQHEKDMEISFAVARSKDKTCGICFDVIVEKELHEQRFGVLPNCNHVFCLSCIRKWRQAKQFESKITRACPECRIPSDYVCPSPYWVDTKEDKAKLLETYKTALGKKDCKYFKKGEGKCPFGNKCFYKHALPNGQLVDVGVPQKVVRKVQRSDDEILELFDQVFPQIFLWDFVDRRDIGSRLSTDTEGSENWSEENYFE